MSHRANCCYGHRFFVLLLLLPDGSASTPPPPGNRVFAETLRAFRRELVLQGSAGSASLVLDIWSQRQLPWRPSLMSQALCTPPQVEGSEHKQPSCLQGNSSVCDCGTLPVLQSTRLTVRLVGSTTTGNRLTARLVRTDSRTLTTSLVPLGKQPLRL